MRVVQLSTLAKLSKPAAGCTLLVALSLLVACGGQGKKSSTPGVDVKNKTITIGSSAPKTGPQVAYYENIQAAQAVLNAVNAKGGVNGWKVKYKVLDDAYQPSRALANVKDLVDKDQVFAIVTQTGTTGVSASLPYLASTTTPDVGIIAEAGLLVGKKLTAAKNIFPTIPAYGQVAAYVVKYLNGKGINKISLMYQDDDSGAAVLPGVKYQTKQLGMNLATTVPIPDEVSDFSGYASRLKAAGAPEVFAWGPPPMVAGTMKACAAIGYKPHWIAPFFVPTDSFFKLVGPLAKGMEFETWLKPLNDPGAGMHAFLSAMHGVGDQNPSILAEGAYISMYTFVNALKTATDGGKTPTQQAVMNALSSGEKFEPGDLGITISYAGDSQLPDYPEQILTYDGTKLKAATPQQQAPKVPQSILR